jgi:cell division transport system ATP-binding protein
MSLVLSQSLHALVELQDVTVAFDGQLVLNRVNMELKPGEFVYLVGQSGAGKTTLLRLIYMDLLPQSGKVIVNDYDSETVRKKDIPLLRRKVGIVFQDFRLMEDRNIFDNIALTLQVTGARSNDIKKKVLRVLADVGLSHKRFSMPNELSGGEQQRIVIARALVNEPFILLADEPTGNLDPIVSFEILKLLKHINTRGTAVLMATHNYELVRKLPQRIIQIKDGDLQDVELKK